jgi:4-amino-4-deoxy-L-arabinose transferase-like glycosyltransferase
MRDDAGVNARLTRQLCLAVVAAATTWCALAVGWNLFARVGAGHDALVASRGMMAENFWKWGIWGPVREYTVDKPTAQNYYTHHPFGTYWLAGLFAKIFGRHAFVPRLGPLLQSVAIPPLLYGIGRRLWDPVAGALSALAYVVLPMSLAFGSLAGFEVPTAFAALVTTWGYLRFTEHWQKRWMLVSLLGVAWGVNVDWNYVIFLGGALGLLTLGVVFLPARLYGRVPLRPFVQWALLAAAIATTCVVAWVWYFHQIGALEGLLQSDAKRTRGVEIPLDTVLRARSWWIDVTFTPLAVFLGKLAFPILVVRIVLLRRTREVLVLSIWLMAVVTYVKFKNGADVHIYWPFAFTAYFALAFGLLAHSAIALTEWLLARIGRPDRRAVVPMVVLGVLGLVPLAILPDGIEGLRYGKATGGRFNEKGSRDFRDVDKAQALEFMGERTEPGLIVLMHDSMRSTWALDWAMHRTLHGIDKLPGDKTPPEERYFVADLDFLPAPDQRKLAESYKLLVVDHFVMADRLATKGPVEAYVFDERQPTLLEWYLAYGTEPVRTVRPDPWATWELRDAWGQAPNPAPAGQPQTLEQQRIAHNVAVARNDTAGADLLEKQILAQLDTSVSTGFGDGTRLIGQRLDKGVLPVLTLMFRAAATSNDEFEFAIASVMDARKPLSLVPPDDRVKQLGAPFPVTPREWRAGYIYAEHAPIHHRPGKERFAGRFEPMGKDFHGPKPVSGEGEVPLVVLQ